MYKTAAWHVGVNELPLGLLGIIEQFVLTMHEIGHNIVPVSLSHAQVFYCKYPGMKLENWDAGP